MGTKRRHITEKNFQLNSRDSGQTREFTQVYSESTEPALSLHNNEFASELTRKDQVNSLTRKSL